MLGWEFPPFFNGGLGVASAGIAEALGGITHLTLVVPRAERSFDPKPYDLVGLHQRMLPAYEETHQKVYETLQERVKLAYVEVNLTGYERLPALIRKSIPQKEVFKVTKVVDETVTHPSQPFLVEDLYGEDLPLRIQQYGQLVLDLAEGFDFEVIHAHDWMTFLAGLELKAHFQKPLVLHIHSLSYDRNGPLERGYVYELERHAMLQADHIITVSQYTSDTISKYYGIAAHHITAIHNGLTPRPRYRIAKPFPQKLVVFLGRLTDQKGPLHFFEAAKALLKQTDDVRFIVAGKGELIDRMLRATAKEKLGDRIHFTGFLDTDRATDILAMADAYVMPSVSEPFGLAALEAAQMGVPCVISEQSGVREVLPHAIQVDYADATKIAKTLYGLLEDHAWRDQVIAGQLQDLKTVSWDQTASQILSVYDSVLS